MFLAFQLESFQTDKNGLFYSNAKNMIDFEILQKEGWFGEMQEDDLSQSQVARNRSPSKSGSMMMKRSSNSASNIKNKNNQKIY